MGLTLEDIKRIAREELQYLQEKKSRYPSQFVTSKGKEVPYGSDRHVKDLEDTLERLKNARSRQRRGTPAKTDMTRAISRIKSELAKVNRYVERQEK